MAKWDKKKSEVKNTKFINPTKELVSKENAHLELVKFSFKYLDTEHQSYLISDRDTDYFLKFLERIKTICRMTCASLKYPTVQSLRNHYINWDHTTQDCFGLPNEEQLVDKPFQFGISANEHGRVIGFFINQTFYVVWFDPKHNTYN
ncbi:hypothetical protein KXQ82_01010 [Mucilaginibacter sp. HMF5004]|uniref:hypothetical protein n=1 Tax=Mucilaginibacter rivuli TaxID=2857527 RepID=UPI001C5CC458|nr:hypothetical protein [Mucilaginibacter rivuli]MBW4888268.1 hypothetical protein [Mucilaginibacter rivuli]